MFISGLQFSLSLWTIALWFSVNYIFAFFCELCKWLSAQFIIRWLLVWLQFICLLICVIFRVHMCIFHLHFCTISMCSLDLVYWLFTIYFKCSSIITLLLKLLSYLKWPRSVGNYSSKARKKNEYVKKILLSNLHQFGLSAKHAIIIILNISSTTMFTATDQDHQKMLDRRLLSCRKCSGNGGILIISVYILVLSFQKSYFLTSEIIHQLLCRII